MLQKTIFSILFICLSKNITSQITWILNKDSITTYYYNDGDEFEESTLNTTKWKYWYGWCRSIPHQQEKQYYTDGKNQELKNGYLNLFAKREKINARLVDWLPDSDSIKIGENKFNGFNKRSFNYTAGMIQSETKYKYGYFEIKFKIPKEGGYWPAFWLYGGTPNEEIDWMELKTEDYNAIHVGRHSKKRDENKLRGFILKKWWGGNVYFKGDLRNGYNIISGEWTPEYLKYFLNGECISYTKIKLSEEKVLCANIAVPSNNGPFKPGPDTNIIQSGNFEIDYIRVWNKEKSKLNPFPIIMYNNKTDTIAQTTLKSKTRFLYGKRSDHVNEGIIVSLTPYMNTYNLQVLGKNIPKSASYKIVNTQNQIVIQSYLKYGNTIIPINNNELKKLELIIECYDKTIHYELPNFQ